MSEKLFCSHCGAEIDRDEMFEFDGAVYCADCIDELATLCDCCNTRIRRGDVHGDGETELCIRQALADCTFTSIAPRLEEPLIRRRMSYHGLCILSKITGTSF